MAHVRTSNRNPPKFNYERPSERKFYIWQDRFIHWDKVWADRHNREERPWRWLCTFCDPPAAGFRSKKGAFEAIIRHMDRHFRIRHYHHRHVARSQ